MRVIDDFNGGIDGRDSGSRSITLAAINNTNFIIVFNTARFQCSLAIINST